MTEEKIKLFIPLIIKIANKFYGVEKEDLIQAGLLGLSIAYKHYNKDNNTKFSSFAYFYIYGEMYNLVINSKNLKNNKEYLKIMKLVNKAEEYLALELKREPSINEIATYLKLDIDLIKKVKEINNPLSLDQEQEGDTNLYNTIKVNVNNDLLFDIKNSIDMLEEPDRSIIINRYFNDLTQSEVGKLLGLSQVKVSRYEKRSLVKMRSYLE